ncbi:hypothetical protein [Bradyrhizobium elkanii]|uniref:Uncharacterized protein n=1 Tax=Bradyrhizobium elkanii TaxID=29448 RepID=A0ABV4F071_BRAEL|nr:hypothetical protein [Bradyrhizobium elkanii]MCP1757846.1 hypothetical protein [Bradyrhizobium elkanii]MCS3881857.1 hypothetical protein [Bradyrhizobium elkanii]MCS4218616.1 hypothetical protein [Bradyrhizobium elkanii]MCW2110084.1 hypothetical protein [Bradyrhizobium elkanii]MCW2201544.1 hypothetical protein [Bradyrhizobium elkanii]
MSKIVAFRDNIIDAIKELIPDLDVEWYDGLFDEHDIADWVLKTPCARVAVMNVPTNHLSTGELNAHLRVVVVIVDENRAVDRDGDARAWDFVEQIAVWANLNQFGNPDAAPATNVKFQRLSQPVLRREGVSVGVVEWLSNLTIGVNRARQRDMAFHLGLPVEKMPLTTVVTSSDIHQGDRHLFESEDVTPEEE